MLQVCKLLNPCYVLRICSIGLAVILFDANAQKNTLDSLHVVLQKSKTASDSLRTYNLITRAWQNRQLDSAFSISSSTIKFAAARRDTLQLAMAYFHRARILVGIARYDRIYEGYKICEQALQLLSAKKFDILRSLIRAYADGLILRTDNFSNNKILINKSFLRQDSIYVTTLKRCRDQYIADKDWLMAAEIQDEIIIEDIRTAWWVYSDKSTHAILLDEKMKQTQEGVDFYLSANFREGIARVRRHSAYYHFYAIRDIAKAEKFFRMGYVQASRVGNKVEESLNLNGLAYCDLDQLEFDSTLLRAKRALTLAQQIHDADLIMRFQQTFYDAYLTMKEGDKALPYIERYLSLKDSLIGSSSVISISEIETRNRIFEQQKEVEQLRLNDLKSDQQKTVLVIVAGSFLVIIVLIVLMFRNRQHYQKKIKDAELNQKLQEQKELIGRDLHDSLGSRLSSISVGLNRALNTGKSEQLVFVQELADLAMNELRDSLWVMDKRDITLGELDERVKTLFWQYQKNELPIELEVTTTGLPDQKLSALQAGQIFRIIQEAINNAVKHSGAGKISVSFSILNDVLHTSVIDNGNGFVWPADRQQGHFGLQNMLKRAEKLSAILEVKTSPGSGTAIHLVVPLI